MDGPTGRDDDSVCVAQQVVGDHAAWRHGLWPSLEDDQVKLPARSCASALFRRLGHVGTMEGSAIAKSTRRADEPAQHRENRRCAQVRCARHGAPWRRARPPPALGDALALLSQRQRLRSTRDAPATAPRAVDEAQAVPPRAVSGAGTPPTDSGTAPRGGKDAPARWTAAGRAGDGLDSFTQTEPEDRSKVNFVYGLYELELAVELVEVTMLIGSCVFLLCLSASCVWSVSASRFTLFFIT